MTAIAIPARQRHVRDALLIQLCDELCEILWLLQMRGRLSDKQLQDSIDIGISQTLK